MYPQWIAHTGWRWQLLSSLDSQHRVGMTVVIFSGEFAQDHGLQLVTSVYRQSITEIGCMVIAIFSRQSTHGIKVAIAVISTQSSPHICTG